MSQTASFNGIDWITSVPGLIVVGIVSQRYPDIDFDIQGISSADKSVTAGNDLKSKKLNVQVEIGRDTRALLDASLDTLYGILQGRNKTLILPVGSGNRKWTAATVSNVMIGEIKGGHGTFDIEFTNEDPFGYDVNSTSLFSTSLTGASSTTNFIGVMGGSALWQVPQITITINSVTGGSSSTYFSITNPATSQALTVTTNPTNGDIFVIDCQARTVTKNGTEINTISGAFPEWQTGLAGSLSYTDTFTTRNRTMSGLYYKRYA